MYQHVIGLSEHIELNWININIHVSSYRLYSSDHRIYRTGRLNLLLCFLMFWRIWPQGFGVFCKFITLYRCVLIEKPVLNKQIHSWKKVLKYIWLGIYFEFVYWYKCSYEITKK